jgi:spermidine synthase
MALTAATNSAVVLERVETPRGELVLRRDGEDFEVISNGVFLMDTRNGESERLLVRRALDHGGVRSILIGGLGVGFSLLEALSDPRVSAVFVAELEPTVVGWHRERLRHLTGDALADPRAQVVVGDVYELMRDCDEVYDAICLDVDNGPSWTVSESNDRLYGDAGTALLAGRLHAGGVLTVWSATRSAAYEQVLRRHFGKVDVVEVPVSRGEPDVVFTARAAVTQTQGRDSDSS